MSPLDPPHPTSTAVALVDLIAHGEAASLSVGWPATETTTRPIDAADQELLRGRLEALSEAEQRGRDAEIMAQRGAVGRALWELLDGPEGHLTRAMRTAESQDDPLDLVVRLRVGSGGGPLAAHPTTTWRWELLSPAAGEHPTADGRIRLAVQLGNAQPRPTARILEHGGLRIMFMAYSPQGAEPVLDYEGEEERLLQALERPIHEHRAQVQVVEDGTLDELERRIAETEADVVHLTGHGVLTPEGPRLIMEDALGWPDSVTPGDLLRVLKRARKKPELVVISSCHSADGRDGTPSFAAALVAGGIRSVLGWVRPVRDKIATQATADLYGRLCSGETPAEAVAFAREQLRERDDTDAREGRTRSHAWGTLHLLTRDAAGFAVDTKASAPLPSTAMAGKALYRYLGVTGGMKVLDRGFLGRRRQLQRVLRLLRSGEDEHGAPVAGVTVLGMKGVGKSCLVGRALARHLQDRCSTGWVVLHGKLDDVTVVQRFLDLAEKRDDDRAKAILQYDEPVPERLKKLLTACWSEESIVIVLDDFEQNLELRQDGDALLQPEAAALLEVLLPACQAHQPALLVTTTASFQVPTHYEQAMVELRVGCFEPPTVRKLWTRMMEEGCDVVSSAAWSHLAKRLGRNARVLDWAKTLLQGKSPKEAAEIAREADEVLPAWEEGSLPSEERIAELARLFLRTLAVEETRKKLSADALTFIERARVYEWPVPAEAFEGLLEGLDVRLDRDITVLQNLGMLEVGEMDGVRAHRVSPLVEPEFEAEDAERWHAAAAEFWEKASGRKGTREVFERVQRAWEHALAGHCEAVAGRCGRIIDAQLNRRGQYLDNRTRARRHLGVFPDSEMGLLWAGKAEQRAGDAQEGWALYERGEAMAVARGVSGTELGRVLWQGSDILETLGRYTDAEERLQRTIATAAQESEPDHGLVAHASHSLAFVQLKMGQLSDARANFEQAVETKAKLYETKEHSDVAASLHALAGVLQAQGDLGGARAKLERSLAIKAKVHGTEEHPDVAASLHELAGVLKAEDKPDQAVATYRRVLEIEAGVFGTLDQYHSAETEVALGLLLLEMGRREQAREPLAHAYAVLRAQVPNHPAMKILRTLFGDAPAFDPSHLANAALQARQTGEPPPHDLLEGLSAMARAGSPHDTIAAMLEVIAKGDPIPTIDTDLPEPIAAFVEQVLEVANRIDSAAHSSGS